MAVAVVLLATAGFGGIGLLLAGVLRAEVNLAAANGLWLLLLLVSGMLAPLSKLPGGLQARGQGSSPPPPWPTPCTDALGLGPAVPGWAWLVLVALGGRRSGSWPRSRSDGSDWPMGLGHGSNWPMGIGRWR